MLKLCGIMLLLPAVMSAQQDAVTRLRAVLPSDVSDQVIAIVQEASASGLPGEAVANRALEAQAKGKNGAAVAVAARALQSDLAASRDELSAGGRTPDSVEIEAGAAAHALGVDGKTISALASAAPSGRSLTVPLAVLGALVDRGLPAADALAAVRERLADRASNNDLADMPGEAGRMIAAGEKPPQVGRALGASAASGPSAAAWSHPGGPPETVPSNNGSTPGRSRRPRNR
ncbi:MAG: hypothetical protein HY700_00020 [Gemmatimonadetes bacterium]|nr:hypothetical protein [Gemmatimonadota bacterium]